MKIVALVTHQGTACAETILLDREDTPQNRMLVESRNCFGRWDDPVPGSWTDCSDNEALWPVGKGL